MSLLSLIRTLKNFLWPSSEARLLAELCKLREHFWGRNQFDEQASTLDLGLFSPLGLNLRPVKTLLVRGEYRLAHDYIHEDIKQSTMESLRSVTLVTGQPGIGKTLFLYYVLARRLHEQGPVAFQINALQFALFDQDGVSLFSAQLAFIPPRANIWTLSDSDSNSMNICTAFQSAHVHVIHTSSPAASRWKNWVKRLSADIYIMDVWQREEIEKLLALDGGRNYDRGMSLFEKYGPNPRVIIDILVRPQRDGRYEQEVIAAATTLASKFSLETQQRYGYVVSRLAIGQ